MIFDIPTLQTKRLTLRAPTQDDLAPFAEFIAAERSKYVSGPVNFHFASRAWGHAAGLWILRGYGPFTWCLKDGTPIGHGGLWFPANWPEAEFAWSLWSEEYEGQGYVHEAMSALLPWTWAQTGLTTATSIIDDSNAASLKVAKRLGAVLDQDMTDTLNKPDSIFFEENGDTALVYRHTYQVAA